MAGEGGGVVRVPRLLSSDASMWLTGAVTLIGVVSVAVWAVLTQPPLNAGFGVGGALVVAVLVGGLAVRRHELDTVDGSLVRAWGPGLRRRIPWRTAQVRLVPNRGGQLMLAVCPPGGRAAHLPLVAADLGGARSQASGFLRVLADEVERGGHQAIAGRLRAQVDHLDAGGEVLGSPLHRLMARPG